MLEMELMEILKLFAPIIVLELLLKVFCFYRLTKDEVKYLPKLAWAAIILFVSSIGPISFLLIGRKKY